MLFNGKFFAADMSLFRGWIYWELRDTVLKEERALETAVSGEGG
jgi:hypothetical protein